VPYIQFSQRIWIYRFWNANRMINCTKIQKTCHLLTCFRENRKYRMAQKSFYREKNLNISITALPNGLIFLPRIEACLHSKSIRTRLMKTFVNYHYWRQQKNFTFSQIGKKTIYLTKGLLRHVFIDIKLEDGSIIDKKNQLVCSSRNEDNQCFFGEPTFGHPVHWIFPTCEKVNFFVEVKNGS